MRETFSDTIIFDKFLISPKLYILIFYYSTLSVDISKLIIYYTDGHDVDEDNRTVVYHGGYWPSDTGVGVAARYTDLIPSHISDRVA